MAATLRRRRRTVILGIGVDIVEIDRMRQMLDTSGERLIARIFTEGEARYALARVEPALHFAARAAAKEATYKALSGNHLARAVGWREIEVCLRDDDGAPYLVLHGRAQERAHELGVSRALVSLTHSKSAAVAVVVLERGP
jgi:holo-[acyl-carrier protein] synthase